MLFNLRPEAMMSSISGAAKNFLNASVQILNQPIVKEGVKRVLGTVTFAFGLVAIYDIYQISQGREISTETFPNSPKWVQVAHKVIIVCAKISIILSAGVSQPGVFIISSLVGCFFSTGQLDQVFGPNTIFAVNPWHPRHVISIAAVILALPSIIKSTYEGINWAYNKFQEYQTTPPDVQNDWLTDAKVRLIALFNTATSRPTLHMGNQLAQFFVAQ
jgi:hypothetical protein